MHNLVLVHAWKSSGPKNTSSECKVQPLLTLILRMVRGLPRFSYRKNAEHAVCVCVAGLPLLGFRDDVGMPRVVASEIAVSL